MGCGILLQALTVTALVQRLLASTPRAATSSMRSAHPPAADSETNLNIKCGRVSYASLSMREHKASMSGLKYGQFPPQNSRKSTILEVFISCMVQSPVSNMWPLVRGF